MKAVRLGRSRDVDGAPERRGYELTPPPPAPLVKFQAPEIVFGVGSLGEAGFAAGRLGARRPFVVTDPGIVEAGWVDELLARLEDVGLAAVVWTDVTPNPKDREIRAAHQRYAETGCDVIVAIGGGSCIDAAKGVAILSGNGGDILDYAGVDQVAKPIPPLLMIPSTSGTGLRLQVRGSGPDHLLEQPSRPLDGAHQRPGDRVHGAHGPLHSLVGAHVGPVVRGLPRPDPRQGRQVRSRAGPGHRRYLSGAPTARPGRGSRCRPRTPTAGWWPGRRRRAWCAPAGRRPPR
ncbi:MAG: iron-containing alcohol dehydrogenase [Pseudonocardia sp.]|nr:iron-containing alcohol dehydrogenase [Pseudonocardia sp.]